MTAVEEVQAAIAKLERIKAQPVSTMHVSGEMTEEGAAWFERATEKLALFNATINAQLAVMRNYTEVYGDAKTPYGYAQSILTLARAINGTK